MSLTSNSPRKVILAALAVGMEALPDYAHRCSPKVFTQPQLLACLAYMTFLRTDYRGAEAHLADLPAVRDWIGLKKTPDHSTLHKAAQRFFGPAVTARLLHAALRLTLGRRRIIRRAAADSTGLEAGHRSPYFVRRKARGRCDAKRPVIQALSYRRWPKLTLLADCARHLILALLPGRGPRPDIDELAPLLAGVPPGVILATLLADAGFDSEPNHELLRNEHGIAGLIPPKHGRPRQDGGPPGGYWRGRMARRLRTKRRRKRSGFTQRWQVETVMSMIKRNLGDELSAVGRPAQRRQMRLRVLVHNIMILMAQGGFRQSNMALFLWRMEI